MLSSTYFIALVRERIIRMDIEALAADTGFDETEIVETFDKNTDAIDKFLVLMAQAGYRIAERGKYVNFVDEYNEDDDEQPRPVENN